VQRTSRSKSERIKIKMGAAQCGMREHKKGAVGHVGAGDGRILLLCKSILLFFARARGTKCNSFFLLLIGFKGYRIITLGY
jgi:hypothetical protein